MSEDNNVNQLKILCPYCNAEWDAEMEAQLDAFNAGCETCGYGASATFTVSITCSNCGRVVYRKETESEM